MAGLTAKRRVLMVGGEGVVLYGPSGGGVERETAISWDVPNFDQQLASALRDRNSGRSLLILFDGADQAYRKEENIPKLSPFDRPRFVRRKLELAFPSYPIRAALEVVPEKGGKKSGAPPSYLFVALPETDQLDRVSKAIFESGTAVSGFGLLPVESAGLVTALTEKLFSGGKRSRWAVLIGQHETGGLRQVVVKDGNLALARLTPPSEAGTSGAGWAEEVARGFKETLAYVSRFGFTPDEGLDLVIVCGPLEKQFLSAADLPANNFRCLTTGEALALAGARATADKSNFADALHAAWAGRKTSLRLPVRVPSIHHIMAPRLAARMGSVVLVFLSVGLAALTLDRYQDYLAVREELGIKQNQQQMMQREYEQEAKAFDALPVKPGLIKNALTVKERLEAGTVRPGPVLARLKAVLGPDILLELLDYEHTPPPGLDLSGGNAAAGGGGLFGGTEAGEKGRIRLSFRFTLPDSLPLEQKVMRAEQLQQELETRFPGWDVSIAAQFGKVSRGGMFEGKTSATDGPPPLANDFAEMTMEGAPL